jgi:RNA polymerase sigma factor (TIGR02999 family)
MTSEASLEIRSLMSRFRAGDREAAGALVDHFYPELRRLAATKMRRESTDHTWTPTALVNELYLELVKIRALRDVAADSNERDSFLGLAGYIMRRLLIHHSRPSYRKAQKLEPEVLDHAAYLDASGGAAALAEVEDLLNRLARIDPRLRTVVEMRVFEGKTVDETAEAIGCSPRTIQTQWGFAKRWLGQELKR